MTQPLRILHIITGLDTGGAEMMLVKLLRAHDRSRFAHRVISLLSPGPLSDHVRDTGTPVDTLRLRRGQIPGPVRMLRLRRWVRKYRPDVIQGWMVHGNLAAVLARGHGVPVVWVIQGALYHMGYERPLTRLVINLSARLSRRVTRIVYDARAGADHFEGVGYATDRRLVIPNGFDTAVFRPDPAARAAVRSGLDLREDALVVGLVARYDHVKDHGTFLEAARRTVVSGVDAHFLLAGRGVDSGNGHLASLATVPELSGRVLLLGERRDVAQLYAACDVACLSSYSEGFPHALGEAMACGVPCVATDVGDVAWVLGDTGTVVPPRDPAALAAALGNMLRLSPQARAELGARARARIEECFSLPSVVAQYETLFVETAAVALTAPVPPQSP